MDKAIVKAVHTLGCDQPTDVTIRHILKVESVSLVHSEREEENLCATAVCVNLAIFCGRRTKSAHAQNSNPYAVWTKFCFVRMRCSRLAIQILQY